MPTKPKKLKAIPQPFCVVCGAVEELLERALTAAGDSGSALLCGSCWGAYCEQTGTPLDGSPSRTPPRQIGGARLGLLRHAPPTHTTS